MKTLDMTAADCLDLLHKVRDVTFSTVDTAGLPQARIIDVMLVQDQKLYFLTSRGKSFHKQLMANPHVAIVGLDRDTWQTVRVMGEAHRLEDRRLWIDCMFEANPGMNDVYPGEARYILDPFVVETAEVELFDLSHEPIDRQSLAIGSATPRVEGFVIGDGCIGCGTCQSVCPQQCIDDDMPFFINQEHCLHCGLCFENCPVEAIVTR